jgi:streptogramin lyase
MYKKFESILAPCFIILLFFPAFGFTEATYVFERMWPTLQQPWYFTRPEGVTTDSEDFVYVADTYNHRIQKFTTDGQFVATWGSEGNGQGELLFPSDVTVDNNGFVYVTEWGNHWIHKFTTGGQFVDRWGGRGIGPGELFEPRSIATDERGFIYVADSGNHRIQKFTTDGQYVLQWDRWADGDGFFNDPRGIAVDDNGLIYVVDKSIWVHKFTSEGQHVEDIVVGPTNNNRGIDVDKNGFIYITRYYARAVWKFTPDGQLVTEWGSYGRGDGEFYDHTGLAVDSKGFVYVADTGNDRIQKFTSNGEFISSWSSKGGKKGMFHTPSGVAVDNNGFVYVTEWSGYRVTGWYGRIQKFTPDGEFLIEWDTQGTGGEGLKALYAIAVDPMGYLYVADTYEHSILKFTLNGQFVTKWGGEGTGDGEFNNPCGIAVDSDGFVYVADWLNHRIQKFTSDGQFVDKWDNQVGQVEYAIPESITVHGNEFVYLAATDHYIRKFTTEGEFVMKWGGEGIGDGEFREPHAITVDSDGFVYVAEWFNQRIQKFTPNGEFVTKFSEFGSNPGQLNYPLGIAVNGEGKVYVAEGNNNRIQIYNKVDIAEGLTKAIIVAGGGPYYGNNLWNATQLNANFAYRTLTHQGFTKESIYYLTSDSDLDLDSNGELDDVDGDATNSNLQQAIMSWASDADSLVLYLVDHGGDNTFRMSGNQTLNASDLDSWLDSWQTTLSGKVIVIYDACESGSFLLSLIPPVDKERIIITSTSSGESAYFVTQGSISFSNYFWTHIFNGLAVKDAFVLSQESISFATAYQNPLLDANGNGNGNQAEDFSLVQNIYIGNGTQIHGSAPVIGAVSPAQTISGTNSTPLFADNVTDEDGVARVWAVIRPPDYSQGSPDNPVHELPSIDLMPAGENRFEASYDNFSITGTYQITIYARDRIGNSATPKLTSVSVENPLQRKAIIVVGALFSDGIWTGIERNVKLSYEALSFQGYTNDDIYLLSPASIPGVTKIPVLPTLSNLSYALNNWAVSNTQDVVLYLIGQGESGSFQINSTETLTASLLDGWLDSLQSSIPGKVSVIYDACRSGSFLSFLRPPADRERIVLASTGGNQAACFLSDGDISFSKYFWTRVANGTNVRDAFLHAKQAVEFTTSMLAGGPVIARLDDNGNGLGNEKSDGQLASNYTIGVGIMLAGDDPLIGAISSQQVVSQGGSATIWVDDVTTTGSIASVWAVIKPPGYTTVGASDPIIDMPIVDLTPTGSNRYEGTINGFSNFGIHWVSAYATDTEGATSLPKETAVCYVNCSDNYEEDDTYQQATVIVINDESAQQHNFHDNGDQDWVKFYGVAGQTYTIEVNNTEANCDAVIKLYDTDGVSPLSNRDDTGPGEDEELSWPCPQDGIYYVSIHQFLPGDYGENTGYELRVYRPIGPLSGFVTGVITDRFSAQELGDVRIKTNSNQSALSLSTGSYLLVHPPGTVSFTLQKDGYNTEIVPGVQISEGGITSLDIVLTPAPGDTDGDGIPDMVENSVDCLNPNDDDSDDDGILDGNEDTDYDGELDPGETDPCDEDTDNDGLLDGTEIGLTAPQGSDTDLAVFIKDADPETTTDPLDDDSDNDGWLDGEEDANQNGQVDENETDPNKPDKKSLSWLILLLFGE